jgi:hypothetical protein
MRRSAIAAVATTVGAILVATSLTGCAAIGSVLAAGGVLPGHASVVDASPPPLQHYSDGSTSERGNIPKVVGQKAGMLSYDRRTRLVTFTVTRIVADPHCLNQGAPAPQNGHYVEVDLQVVTTADLGIDDSDPTVSFAPLNWFYYPPDKPGMIAGGIGAARNGDDCELSVPSLPDSIGPSQTVSGSVLLDVIPGAVYLAYAPDNDCGCGASWEWPYAGT